MDKYIDSILKDLLANLNSHDWQSRQARYEQHSDITCVMTHLSYSCLALCDLLSIASTRDVATSLAQLWELCLRARDDIKVMLS